MSKLQITPGPWALRGYQVRAGDGLGAHVATYERHEPDGCLIAAAPELYAALEAMVACQPSVMAPFGKLYEATERAKAALQLAAKAHRYAKPEGEWP